MQFNGVVSKPTGHCLKVKGVCEVDCGTAVYYK